MNGQANNKFLVRVNQKTITFTGKTNIDPNSILSGVKRGITWTRKYLSKADGLVIHKLTLTIPDSEFKNSHELKVSFDVRLTEGLALMSCGIDDIRVTAGPLGEINKCAAQKKEAARRRRNRRSLEDVVAATGMPRAPAEVEAAVNKSTPAPTAAPRVECRNAFAYHSKSVSSSFRDIVGSNGSDDMKYNDDDIGWGWTNGPLMPSNYAYSMDLFAPSTSESGLGKPTGAMVGSMTVEYDGDEATVTVQVGQSWWLKETNAYVGHSSLPVTSSGLITDPNLYPIAHRRSSMSRTFTVEEMESQPIHVIAHMVVCGDFSEEPAQTQGVRGDAVSTGSNPQTWTDGLLSTVTGLFKR